MSYVSRRDFLKFSASCLAVAGVSTLLTGCNPLGSQQQLSAVVFSHGVASGDASQSAIILWTRAIPTLATENTITLAWQLATDAEFSELVRSGQASTSAEKDFTVKIDVQQLVAGQRYYYRFIAANGESRVGQTRTLPAEGLAPWKLAVFSCSNYPAGYFHVYREACKRQDLDAVVHLGDYIYEYPADGYASEYAEQLGRTLAPDNTTETISLTDYRKRYALYRTDPDLQELHATLPWYLVWDDHEISNDTWYSGAENHQPETEGDFFVRRAAAVQAYYEWLPIRPPMGEESIQIYRSFQCGDLASLYLLDTRLIARDQQLDYKDFIDPQSGAFATDAFRQAMGAERALLGAEQLQWLSGQLRGSKAKWQLLGQQVLMAKMHLPAELLAVTDYSTLPAKLQDLTAAKQRVLLAQQQGRDPEPTDLARVSQLMPYNLDAWDGYPREREQLFATAKMLNKPLVVLAGDTHNAWHSVLSDQHGEVVGVEFATASVSSPGIEKYLSIAPEQAAGLAAAFQLLMPDLQWCNVHQRGFMVLDITAAEVQCHWQFIDSIVTPDYQPGATHQASFTG
ncbi:alkaline phosphatase D family protein [Alkalimonas sp. NCh-2]|uniref:alkaline phosphatase D family protein n=1 Tax=Alkalimonas sp. NCh-2 TaxID=3144846 RepID=UPI0031F675D1